MTEDHIAIIGGGITGASVAYHLSERTDATITIYERHALASETTTKSASFLGYRGGTTRTQLHLKRYGIRQYNQLLTDPRSHAFYWPTGRLQFASTTEGADALEQTYEDAHATSQQRGEVEGPTTYLGGDQLPAAMVLPDLELEKITGCIYQPNVGYIQPFELAYEYLERAKDNGVEIRVNTPVTDVTTDDGRVSGVVADGTHEPASYVVGAAGPWNVEIADWLDLDIPVRHSLAPALILDPQTDTPHRYPSLGHHESGVYLREHPNDTVFVGHYPGGYDEVGTRYDPGAVDDDVPPDVLDEMIDAVQAFIPYLYDAEIAEEWVGVRSLTPDTDPIIGWTDVEGYLTATYNATGIQYAPAAGKIITDQIVDGDPTTHYDGVSITRFDGHTDRQTEGL